MKTNFRPVHPFPLCSIPRTRSSAQRVHRRTLVLAVLAVIAHTIFASTARAGAPPAVEREGDPLDFFLDRARGERTADEPHAGSILIGAAASFGASSRASPSFGILGFVQVPFDRLYEGRRRELGAMLYADRNARVRVPEVPAPSPEPAPAAPESAPAEAEKKAPPPAPLLTPDLARGAVRAACKAAKLDEADARLDGLASRARTSALLPELRLRATRAIDETEALTPTEYDPSRRTASGSTTTWLEARATFRLDRLVFADDEIAVERQRMARAAERTKLVAKVLDLLDAWQRARAAEVDPEAKQDVRTRAILAAASAEASLDVLTDGWFSKAIAAPSAKHDTGVTVARSSPFTPQDVQATPRDADAATRDAPVDPVRTGSAPDASHPSAGHAPAAPARSDMPAKQGGSAQHAPHRDGAP